MHHGFHQRGLKLFRAMILAKTTAGIEDIKPLQWVSGTNIMSGGPKQRPAFLELNYQWEFGELSSSAVKMIVIVMMMVLMMITIITRVLML